MRKADCTPEQWARYRAYQREYARTHKRVYKNRSAEQYEYHQRPDVKAKRQEYDRRPEVIARRKERNKSEGTKAKRKAKYHALMSDPTKKRTAAEKHRFWRTGFTPEHIEGLLDLQGNACAICRRSFKRLRWHADHCHASGSPRGLLCHNCNIVEGLLKGTKISLKEYLARLEHYLTETPFQKLLAHNRFGVD